MTIDTPSSGEASRAENLRDHFRLDSQAVAPVDPMHDVEAALNAAQPAGGAPIVVTALELWLIRGIGRNATLGDVVIFPPEFLYVAEVGRSARAGVSVFWNNGQGYGDPDFPNFTKSKMRSVSGATASAKLYPDVAGDLLFGLNPGADPAAVAALLQAQGLTDVHYSGSLGTAKCGWFEERAIAARLSGAVAGLRYVEANPLVRMNDFAPGWSARRIA